MREELKVLCKEFIENRDLAKEAFVWESSYMPPICAGILTDKNQTLTADKLKEYKQMIKDKTGIFSNFRGTGISPMACMLATGDDAEKLLADALEIHEELKKHFWSSQYLPLVSMIVAQMAEKDRYSYIVQRTKQIYDLMKQEHPFLTSSEDGPFAAMLAFAECSPEAITAEVEKCYQILKPKFFSGNAVQSLSHVLALGEGSAEMKCRKLEELFDALKAKGYKYGTDYELATLGALSILPFDTANMVRDVVEVADFLEGQKGYGFLGATKKQRLMHAATLVSKAYVGEQGASLTGQFLGKENGRIMTSAAINSAIAMIAAEQAAMCAAIAASAAASSASN